MEVLSRRGLSQETTGCFGSFPKTSAGATLAGGLVGAQFLAVPTHLRTGAHGVTSRQILTANFHAFCWVNLLRREVQIPSFSPRFMVSFRHFLN